MLELSMVQVIPLVSFHWSEVWTGQHYECKRSYHSDRSYIHTRVRSLNVTYET